MKRIYLDYAATTPADEDVIKKALPFLGEKFGNPSSLHVFGQEALFAIDKARKITADFLNAKEKEVVFLSSATEANNLAIIGSLRNIKNPHIIVSVFEHKAVLETVKKSGAEVSYLPVSKEGIVDKEELKRMIKDNTALVSIGYANSEIGTIQPIKEIGEMIKEENKNRERKILFHTDAVQAVNYLSCDVEYLNVDLLTMSGHKIYAPKGGAVLYIRDGVKVSPVLYGSGQEKGLNPGTENVFAIVGFGAAIEELKKSDKKEIKRLRDKAIDEILNNISDTKLNGSRDYRLENNLNISFKGLEGEGLMIALDREGVAVSTGSACASGSLEPSHVLLSLGMSHEEAHGSLRVSLGRYTTEKEIDYFLEKLPPIVNKLRKISGR